MHARFIFFRNDDSYVNSLRKRFNSFYDYFPNQHTAIIIRIRFCVGCTAYEKKARFAFQELAHASYICISEQRGKLMNAANLRIFYLF